MKRIVAAVVIGLTALTATIRLVVAQQEEDSVDPRVAAYDRGPSKVDVSKYPDTIKNDYKVFAKKCGGACHGPARAINCEFVLDEEWERYVKRMIRRSGNLITPDDGKQIYDFLTYDSKIRKKAMYDKRMSGGAKPQV